MRSEKIENRTVVMRMTAPKKGHGKYINISEALCDSRCRFFPVFHLCLSSGRSIKKEDIVT